MINVWQTLDVLAGNELYPRIDGFEEVHNWLRTFAKKDSNNPQAQQRSIDNTTGYGGSETCVPTSSNSKSGGSARNERKHNNNSERKDVEKVKKRTKILKKKKKKSDGGEKLPKEYGSIVDCSFNLPRISARLERLMGTNVVRLTDRKYMNELRQRIQEDYNLTLQTRIEKRQAEEDERQKKIIFNGNIKPDTSLPGHAFANTVLLAKELERERKLIISGKTENSSNEFAEHPVLAVSQRITDALTKRRSKLKTNRERNADRLRRQGVKWEKERMRLQELEKQKELEILAIRKQRAELEDDYRMGEKMKLLSLDSTEWEALTEEEKELFQKRFVKKGEQYTSDPDDIINIVLARRQFRDTERKIREQLDSLFRQNSLIPSKDFLAQSSAGSIASRMKAEEELKHNNGRKLSTAMSEMELKEIEEVSSTEEAESSSLIPEIPKNSDQENNTDDIKETNSGADEDNNNNNEIQNDNDEVENIIQENEEQTEEYKFTIDECENVIAPDECDQQIDPKCQTKTISPENRSYLSYEDLKVMKLKEADNVQELYQLAEEIIIGEYHRDPENDVN